MSRLLVAQRALTVPGWAKDDLSRKARAVPSLDLRFADNKSLVDATTGSNLVTFTRASRGTFVGSNGVLQTAVTNLLLRSEEFDNASWTKVRASISANAITAPNGTLTADTGVEDASSSTTHNPLIQDVTIVANGTYTASLYVQAKERSRGAIWFSSTDSANYVAGDFNLTAGTITASNAGTGSGASASINNVGGGWFRVSITGSIGGSLTTGRLVLRMADATGSVVYTGDGTSGIYLWGAQLEQSATVGEYIPTTSTINSAPRFDHNPTTGESLGLLVEEQRTNLLLRSEEFETTWTTTRASISSDLIASPSGTTTADKLVEDTTATNTHFVQQSVSVTTGAAYTFSSFVKAGERNFVQLVLNGQFATVISAIFDLSTGAVGTTTGTPATSAVLLSDGWWRLSITATANATGSTLAQVRVSNSSATATYTGDGASGIYLWGAQLETGAFPTSYIPTTTAAATRSADVASISGSNFSSWYRQDEGTMFGDFLPYTTAGRIFSLNNNSNGERILFNRSSSSGGNINVTVTAGSVAQVDAVILASSIPAFSNNRAAFGYKASDFAGSVNGLTPVTQGTGSLPTCTQATLGNGESVGSNPLNGTIRRLTYWPTRLSNATLQQVTQ